MAEENKAPVLTNHLNAPPPVIDTTNEKVEFELEKDIVPELTKHEKCVLEIQEIFNKGYTPDNGNKLVNYIQKQRSLLIEIMIGNFMKRPDPKMADAMNTLLGQMEKSVRDDRKEALKAKEMETSKETFELFSKSLNAVIDGRIHIPTFGKQSLLLDPLKPLIAPEEAKFKPGEFAIGPQTIDTKSIEIKLQEINDASNGEGELEEIKAPPANPTPIPAPKAA